LLTGVVYNRLERRQRLAPSRAAEASR